MLTLIEAPVTGSTAAAGPARLHDVGSSQGPASATGTPEATLRTLGRTLSRLLSRPDPPARWGARGFARQVETVRAQLAPIPNRRALASSYAREHLHLGTVGPASSPTQLLHRSANDLAYAHRWLELGRPAGVGSRAAALPDR